MQGGYRSERAIFQWRLLNFRTLEIQYLPSQNTEFTLLIRIGVFVSLIVFEGVLPFSEMQMWVFCQNIVWPLLRDYPVEA